jgi:hypothetical protein
MSGAAGNGLSATAKYLRGAAGIGRGTTIKYLRRTTSAAVGNYLETTIKYLVNQNAGAGNNWAKVHYTKAGTNYAESLCSVAACVATTEPHPGARPSVRVCVCVCGLSLLAVFIRKVH